MARQRKSYPGAFKAQVALAALTGDRTANEVAAQHQIHPTLVRNQKQALLQGAASLFADPGKPAKPDGQPQAVGLFEHIGRLKMELEWLEEARRPHPPALHSRTARRLPGG